MQEGPTFWQHLDELRSVIIRSGIAIIGCAIVAFCLREPLFRLVFYPATSSGLIPLFDPQLAGAGSFLNTELAGQFLMHMKVAMAVGVMVASPYVLLELFRFISPALYPNEKRAIVPVLLGGLVMFVLGVLLTYFIIFPITYQFLLGYQVSEVVENRITLDSYISTLLMLSFLMGLMFELPIICWLLAKLGLLTAAPMRRYRRHAIVAIIIVAAVITPTGDAFTLAIVSLPIYLLYELSILLVRLQQK